MIVSDNDADLLARTLIERHGWKARQEMVDGIVRAVREHDIESAKWWEAVGAAVDRELAT